MTKTVQWNYKIHEYVTGTFIYFTQLIADTAHIMTHSIYINIYINILIKY